MTSTSSIDYSAIDRVADALNPELSHDALMAGLRAVFPAVPDAVLAERLAAALINAALDAGAAVSVSTASYEREAYELGVEAAKCAASWVLDGNTSEEHYRRVLAMIDAGDPESDDYLPNTPNLSGEWADDPTPTSLYEDVMGERGDGCEQTHELTDALVDAWERGVGDTFLVECERLLRAAIS